MGDSVVLERLPQQETQLFPYDWNPNVLDLISFYPGFEVPEIETSEIAHLDFETPSIWMSATVIPELAAARKDATLEAETLLEARMQHLRDGEYDLVPLDVDPLSTAARAVEAKKAYGEKSTEYQKARHSLEVDCQRLLAEAWRKGAWEYFAPLEQPFDAEQNSYTFMGRSLTDMVNQGVTPIAHGEEQRLRVNEFVEEKTLVAAQRLGAIALNVNGDKTKRPALSISTISECPDWAVRQYEEHDGQGDFGGYVPEIKKIMIRSVQVESGVRYQEQMGISGTHITHEVVVETMRRAGVIAEAADPTKTEVHATQIVSLGNEKVLDLVKKLDEVATELSGETIFLGEKVTSGHSRDYAAVPAEAAKRQKKLETDSLTLADKLIELKEECTDPSFANGIVSTFVTNMLLQKVKNDPEQAEIVFDRKTAEGVREYQVLRVQGDRNAEMFWLNVQMEAPPASFCGPGSCDLVSESALSKDGQKAVELGLKATDGKIIRDTERACPGCDKKAIRYDDNGSKVCTNCNKKDIKTK